jgi:hypothetical protein
VELSVSVLLSTVFLVGILDPDVEVFAAGDGVARDLVPGGPHERDAVITRGDRVLFEGV